MSFHLRATLVLSLLGAPLAGCGGEEMEMDPSEDPESEIFYDGDEKADGVTPPRPAGGTRTRRGYAWEHDPGPAKDSRWPQLFAQTPNYRALGISVLGGKPLSDEKWRWEFGPMYYRGTLKPQTVKVFVVGQEGAQDESLSNRAFTGSTGTKMQNFLRYIGVDRSVLFMNTFVYTIHGQYAEMDGTVSPKIKWLAQSADSPIVQHRHAMFNYMRETNGDALQLVVGVGLAGRDSVVTWVQSLWNAQQAGLGATRCPSITRCDASVVAPRVRVLGLPHPGAANERHGGEDSLTSLSTQFTKAVSLVSSWVKYNPGWLPMDPGITSRFYGYRYTNYPEPYAHFPWGASFVYGDWGTTSNRRDGNQSIQVYSSEGCYNNAATDPVTGQCQDLLMGGQSLNLSYSYPPDRTTSIPEMKPGDLAYEPPRADATEYDAGPPDALAKLLSNGDKTYPLPDFVALGVTQHWTLSSNGWPYRGRLAQARTLILADQESHDDMFSARALTGVGGQRLQTFLKILGAGTSYGILRSLPVDTLDLQPQQAMAVATDAKVLAILKQALTQAAQLSGTTRVITVGPMAREQWTRMGLVLPGVTVVHLDFPDDGLAHVKGWQDALRALGVGSATDYTGRVYTSVPRLDLPIHTKWWVGTGGTRAARAYNRDTARQDPHYYKLYMPRWVASLYPAPLSPAEAAAVLKAPQ